MSAPALVVFRPRQGVIAVRPIDAHWHVSLFHVNGRHCPIREFDGVPEAIVFGRHQARALATQIVVGPSAGCGS